LHEIFSPIKNLKGEKVPSLLNYQLKQLRLNKKTAKSTHTDVKEEMKTSIFD